MGMAHSIGLYSIYGDWIALRRLRFIQAPPAMIITGGTWITLRKLCSIQATLALPDNPDRSMAYVTTILEADTTRLYLN